MHEPDNKCYSYALKYISRYPKTEQELKIKLLQKGFSEDNTDYAIKYLKSKNFVNDRQFVELYLQSEVVRKWKPLLAVQQKLYHKGIGKDLFQKVVSEFEEETNQGIHTRINKEIQKYKQKDIDGFDIIQRLMRKGYKLDDIKAVIERNAEQQ